MLMQRCLVTMMSCGLLVACSAEPNADDVFADTDAASYSPPSRITVEIRNTSDASVFGMFCPVSLDRRAGEGWEPAANGDPCPLLQLELRPGETTQRTFDTQAGLVAGEYRITFSALESQDGDFIGQLHTNAFQIE